MKDELLWIPWFRKLVNQILSVGRDDFIAKTKQLKWRSDEQREKFLTFGDKGIDPFSFFYLLAYKLFNSNDGQIVHDSVCSYFEIDSSLPIKDYVVPAPAMPFSLLFHNGETFKPDVLWNLFEETTKEVPDFDGNFFEEALKIPQVGVPKLTQTLYLVNPSNFLPVDDKINVIPPDMIGGKLSRFKNEILNSSNGYKNYIDFVKQIKGVFPGCHLYEVNLFLYLQHSEKLINGRSRFYQISINIGNNNIQSDYWNPIEEVFGESLTVQNSFDYVESPGSDRTYSITQPKPGDIVLVSDGQNSGRGIAVVTEVEYKSGVGSKEGCTIHTVWINNQSCQLNGNVSNLAISNAEPGSDSYSAFERAAGYKNSFELIHSLLGSNPVNTNLQLNTIFYGPPGTGKTFTTTKESVEICCGANYVKVNEYEEIRKKFEDLRDKNRIKFVTFHQSYSYEEFVEGLRPEHEEGSGGFSLRPKDGVLKRIASEAKKNPNENFVLIIDEINRANISKVFGELITLLEEDKREEEENEVVVELPYSNEQFSLPKNLYILGTMNTADRSIALIDTALRRRFEFKELSPDPKQVKEEVGGIKLRKVFVTINDRLEWFLDRDHLIGHAWFLGVASRKDVDRKMCRKIIPMIAEYFHDDWKKVYSVVGEGFIRRLDITSPPQFDGDNWEEDRYRWTQRVEDDIPNDAYETLLTGKRTSSQVEQDEMDN